MKLQSIISGTSRTWVKERAAPTIQQILFDPASKSFSAYIVIITLSLTTFYMVILVGKEVLFEESDRVKGIQKLEMRTKAAYGITDKFNRLEENEALKLGK